MLKHSSDIINNKVILLFGLIMIGGGSGALLRYLCGEYISKTFPTNFPFGTFFVNIVGSFIIGFLFFLITKNLMSNYMSGLLITGFLGGFTTFSSFSLDTLKLFQKQLYFLAFSNAFFSVVIGFIFVYFGFMLAKLLL